MKTYPLSLTSAASIAFCEARVAAGFPSPAEPYIADALDFNRYLVQNPSATFAVRCEGHAMLEAGIDHHDVLVVDRSLTPKNNQIVLINTGTAFLVRRCVITHLTHPPRFTFHHQNQSLYEPVLEADDANDLVVVGVVTFVLKDMR